MGVKSFNLTRYTWKRYLKLISDWELPDYLLSDLAHSWNILQWYEVSWFCNYQSSHCKNLTIHHQQFGIDLNNRSRYLFHLYLIKLRSNVMPPSGLWTNILYRSTQLLFITAYNRHEAYCTITISTFKHLYYQAEYLLLMLHLILSLVLI